MSDKKWRSAWRYDGKRFDTIHDVMRTMRHRGPHIGVSAHTCSTPTISDGYEVCVHVMEDGSRCPMRPILSCASLPEALKVSHMLRRACEVWMMEGLGGLDDYDEIDRRIAAIATRLGYRADHHSVWHKSGAWLDTPSHASGVTWRESGFVETAIALWGAK